MTSERGCTRGVVDSFGEDGDVRSFDVTSGEEFIGGGMLRVGSTDGKAGSDNAKGGPAFESSDVGAVANLGGTATWGSGAELINGLVATNSPFCGVTVLAEAPLGDCVCEIG